MYREAGSSALITGERNWTAGRDAGATGVKAAEDEDSWATAASMTVRRRVIWSEILTQHKQN